MPKLSIIIPTFNSASTIQPCLLSIRVQTFTDYEIVIQDGGSSDRTVELIQKFQRENPGITVELEQEPDKGIYDAMNKAMRRAKGAWLYFLGSDDELYDENVLSRILENPDADCSDVLYGNVQMIGKVNLSSDGTIYDGPFDLPKLLTKNICHQAIFYRAVFVAKVGSYNPKYVVLADWDFNMRCWAKGRFSYVDVIVAKFYSGGISTQTRQDPNFRADVTANIIRYFWKHAKETGLSSRVTPRKVVKAFARKLGIAR